MKPYGLISDIHCHAWSAFSTILPNGINSRLQITLDELSRTAQELRNAGGDTLYVAGDIFHNRGSIDPEVFNPTHEAFRDIADGLEIRMIPGNHDLKGRDTTELGNAIQTLGAVDHIEIVTRPRIFGVGTADKVAMIPWQANKNELRARVAEIAHSLDAMGSHVRGETDLIIHVGIDGVLVGVPDSGLSAAEVASWGFRRVFAGDYHHHKVMENGKVISVGATTHQQWGDIGTKAGFLLVYPDRVEFRASHAPNFIELDDTADETDYPMLVDGNYVRVRGMKLTDAEINKFRRELEEMGARGVTFQVTRQVVAARGTSAVAKASTLDESVDRFIDGMAIPEPAHVPLVKEAAADILSSVRSVTA